MKKRNLLFVCFLCASISMNALSPSKKEVKVSKIHLTYYIDMHELNQNVMTEVSNEKKQLLLELLKETKLKMSQYQKRNSSK